MSEQSRTSNSTGDRLFGAITQNPEGLLLLAAGAALLLRKGASTAAGNAAQGAPSSGSSLLKKAAAGAKDYASDVAGRTRETVGSVASSASEYASEAQRVVGEQSERAAQNARSAVQLSFDRVLQEQPLMVAFAGLAAGAAMAAAFPATNFEKETLGPVGEQVADAAGRVGDQLKEAARNAGETLKNAAEERGLNAEGLKDVASEVAGAFGNTMKGETIKAQGPSGQ